MSLTRISFVVNNLVWAVLAGSAGAWLLQSHDSAWSYLVAAAAALSVLIFLLDALNAATRKVILADASSTDVTSYAIRSVAMIAFSAYGALMAEIGLSAWLILALLLGGIANGGIAYAYWQANQRATG